jgi:hypothetical protein
MKINSNADPVRFFKTFAIILLGIIIFDFIIGSAMAQLYKKQKGGLLYRTSYAINETKAEYLVIGSSRASHHYDSKVFEDSLRSTFYNCGRDGQSSLYSCAVVSAIIARYSPKYIIIDILPDEFTQPVSGKLSPLLPYHNNPAIRPYINFNSNFENVKLISKIYPYNSVLTDCLIGLNKNLERDYKGYVKLTKTKEGYRNKIVDTTRYLREENPVDSIKIKALFNLIDKLDKRRIPVLLVISPIAYKNINSITTNVCSSVCKKYSNAKFLNFTNIPAWLDDKYFFDYQHLNSIGADRFSAVIAKHIAADNTNKPISITP